MMIYCGTKDTKESPGALKISGVESLGRMLKRDVKLAHGNQPVAVKDGGWEFESLCGSTQCGRDCG